MTDIQTERAFQKQKGVFMNAKKTSKKDKTPRFFKKIGLDPAMTSSPFVASLVDVVGIGIYAGMATIFL